MFKWKGRVKNPRGWKHCSECFFGLTGGLEVTGWKLNVHVIWKRNGGVWKWSSHLWHFLLLSDSPRAQTDVQWGNGRGHAHHFLRSRYGQDGLIRDALSLTFHVRTQDFIWTQYWEQDFLKTFFSFDFLGMNMNPFGIKSEDCSSPDWSGCNYRIPGIGCGGMSTFEQLKQSVEKAKAVLTAEVVANRESRNYFSASFSSLPNTMGMGMNFSGGGSSNTTTGSSCNDLILPLILPLITTTPSTTPTKTHSMRRESWTHQIKDPSTVSI